MPPFGISASVTCEFCSRRYDLTSTRTEALPSDQPLFSRIVHRHRPVRLLHLRKGYQSIQPMTAPCEVECVQFSTHNDDGASASRCEKSHSDRGRQTERMSSQVQLSQSHRRSHGSAMTDYATRFTALSRGRLLRSDVVILTTVRPLARLTRQVIIPNIT